MIRESTGNLLEADAEALVNTVNCVGFMGKGIALQFKQAFPGNFHDYEKACKAGEVRPGRMLVFETGRCLHPKFIINFPTKRHWRGKSRLEDIELGLKALVDEIRRRKIKSIAVPPLGCGNGGLDWADVGPLIVNALGPLEDVQVLLYPPAGAPAAKKMPVRTSNPEMTVARALFVKAIDQYSRLAYRLTLLEIQKLAYLLQEAGEPLRLKYEPGHYGPYAANLNKVLERIEGHFTRGYGDSQKPDTEIELLGGAVEQADAFLASYPESRERLDRVSALISGFETPYGMELLSSVHWVGTHADPTATDADLAVNMVHCWNERKREMLKSPHIRLAWERLAEQRWV
ncbi:MAG: type II toxin-antitoxin system antitoxin DNA ADP-ribosyl glycohydrolase DarG [Bryobacteraceae bacterium]